MTDIAPKKYVLALLLNLFFLSPLHAEPGWYFGFGLGSGEVEVVGHDRSPQVIKFFAKEGIGIINGSGGQPDDTDTFHLTAGYQFNDYLSLEGSWYDLGETNGAFSAQLVSDASTIRGDIDSEYDATALTIVGQYPVYKRVHIMVQIGLHHWRHEFAISGSNGTASINASDSQAGIDLLYGIGVKVELGASFFLLANWNRFDGIESADGIDIKSISLIYKF